MILRVALCAGAAGVCLLVCGVSRADEADPQAVEQNAAAPVKESVRPVRKLFKLLAIEKNIVRFTNERRKQYGLPPLEIDENLVESARNHAIWMASHRTLQHTSQPVAENIAMGYTSSPEVVEGWMNSAGHRANILSGGHSRIGIAAYEAHDGTIYWCQQFLR
jgi:uncharacterized protein YkwD